MTSYLPPRRRQVGQTPSTVSSGGLPSALPADDVVLVVHHLSLAPKRPRAAELDSQDSMVASTGGLGNAEQEPRGNGAEIIRKLLQMKRLKTYEARLNWLGLVTKSTAFCPAGVD